MREMIWEILAKKVARAFEISEIETRSGLNQKFGWRDPIKPVGDHSTKVF